MNITLNSLKLSLLDIVTAVLASLPITVQSKYNVSLVLQYTDVSEEHCDLGLR